MVWPHNTAKLLKFPEINWFVWVFSSLVVFLFFILLTLFIKQKNISTLTTYLSKNDSAAPAHGLFHDWSHKESIYILLVWIYPLVFTLQNVNVWSDLGDECLQTTSQVTYELEEQTAFLFSKQMSSIFMAKFACLKMCWISVELRNYTNKFITITTQINSQRTITDLMRTNFPCYPDFQVGVRNNKSGGWQLHIIL